MHDINWIRDNPEEFDAAMVRRGLWPHASTILLLDTARRDALTAHQQVKSRQNAMSAEIGKAINSNNHETQKTLRAEALELKAKLPVMEQAIRDAETTLDEFLAALPNIAAADVPNGRGEDENILIRTNGDVVEEEAASHDALGASLGLMDFETATAMAGSRFVVLRGSLARLHRALGQFMLDTHTSKNNYEEIDPPLLVRGPALYGTGQLPKFADDLYRTGDRYLIPTAEVSLTNLVANKVLAADTLPQRFTALTPCFRSEAGSAGRDTTGMIRQHQFVKCELVAVTHPDQSEAEHETMLVCAEDILVSLGLSYRVLTLCTGDMGFSARKTYDIEVWLPHQKRYREISSVSNCGDFQARRMNAKFKDEGGKNRFVHTLNGSGLAVGRTLVAIMENYQNPDGTITVPHVLRSYMNGVTVIGK